MFRILSLDGGGAKGAFTAGFLTELEQILDEPITSYFDLIAGTSTGGVIAVLASIGHPMTEILDIYTRDLHKVFTPNKRYYTSLHGRAFATLTNPFTRMFTGVTVDELFQSKYSFDGTISVIKKFTNNIKMVDINKCRLAIPATNLIQGRPYVFKTPHLPDQSDSYDFYALDVILSTAAAPTYFNPVTLPGYGIFADGGVWANNPGLVAYAEAVKIASDCKRDVDPKFNPSEIHILSVGTGHAIDNFSPPHLRAGVKWWTRKLLELMFEAQTQSSSFYLDRLLHKQYTRVNFERPHPNWGQMDDYRYAAEMAQMGRLMARQKFQMLKEAYFSKKVMPFVPYTK